jgi:Mg-chelatase subunit ChlD
MHRFNSIILGLAIALGAATSLASLAWAAPPAAPRPTPGPPASTCVADGTTQAAPRLLLLGEAVTVTLHARAVCFGDPVYTHIVLVVDPSAAMGGNLAHELQGFLTDIVDKLNLPNNPRTRVGVVLVDETATTASRLTGDVGQVKRAFGRIEPRGDTRIELGIEEGLRLIQQARVDKPYATFIEVMILFSDGRNATGCRAGEKASRKARYNGALLISFCVGRNCDRRCVQPLASSARYFFRWGDPSSFYYIFDRVRYIGLQKISLRKMTLVETLPANMAYVEGSAIPEPSEVATDTRRLVWTANFVPVDGMTITYRVRPLAVGRHPLSLGARAEFRDSQDRVGSVAFPVPVVDVLAPFLVPTATPPAP